MAIAEFLPIASQIADITKANPAKVTTTADHQLIDGLIVRLIVPPAFGMIQADQLFAPVSIINSQQFYIAIDTTLFETFVYDGANVQFVAQAVPIGEINDTIKGATQNVLPFGVFSN